MPVEVRNEFRGEAVLRLAEVAEVERRNAGYVRIRFAGEELVGFDAPGLDDHVRLLLTDDPASARTALGRGPIRQALAALGGSGGAVSRDYTPVAWDPVAGWLDLEFVLHPGGRAAGWAAQASPGDQAVIAGPRGSRYLESDPDWWLVAVDETGLPAARRLLARMPPEASGLVLVEGRGPASVQPLAAPDGVELRWLPAGDAPSTALATALAALPRPAGEGFAFVAAEHGIVRPARALMHHHWGLPRTTAIVNGYWRLGRTGYHAPHH